MMMANPARKFAGTVALLLLVLVYSLLVMVFATSVLPATGGVWPLIFYAVAGFGWVPLAALIVSWMYKPENARPSTKRS